MLISVLEKINDFNEMIFAPIDNLVGNLPLEEWVLDAITDSLHLLPFLFFIFVFSVFVHHHCTNLKRQTEQIDKAFRILV